MLRKCKQWWRSKGVNQAMLTLNHHMRESEPQVLRLYLFNPVLLCRHHPSLAKSLCEFSFCWWIQEIVRNQSKSILKTRLKLLMNNFRRVNFWIPLSHGGTKQIKKQFLERLRDTRSIHWLSHTGGNSRRNSRRYDRYPGSRRYISSSRRSDYIRKYCFRPPHMLAGPLCIQALSCRGTPDTRRRCR